MTPDPLFYTKSACFVPFYGILSGVGSGLIITPTAKEHHMQADFRFSNHGSVCLLTPVSADARDWIDTRLPVDVQRYAGGAVIEPRYAEDILSGITDEGLTVKGAH